jgi:uncharacterized protein with HEPN domain
MSDNRLTIRDRLEAILESINLIVEWTDGRKTAHEFMLTPTGVMAFNACVMRFQVTGEHIGKLLKSVDKPLDKYPDIPWNAIYGMRNFISHEYANIDEEVVVSTINEDIPELKRAIENLLKDY